MKKILLFIFSAFMAVNLAACGGNAPVGSGEAIAQEDGYGTLPPSISMGSGTMGSTNNNIAVAVASVVANNTDTDVKAIATSGSTEWIPMMNQNEIDIGVMANYDALMAYTGQGSFEALSNGEGYDFGILVCGSAQYVVNLVAGSSDIESGEDFKGKRYVNEYPGNDSVTAIAKALLANHGLTEDDINPVAIESIPNAIDALIEGRIDVCQSALAVSKLYDLNSAKGVKFIGLDPSDKAMARTGEFYPAYAVELNSEDSQWITDPIYALAYDNYVVARTTLSNEAAYRITKALYENNKELLEASDATSDWIVDHYVSTNVSLPYHEGAVRYYKEIGIWTDEAQAHQDALIGTLKKQ